MFTENHKNPWSYSDAPVSKVWSIRNHTRGGAGEKHGIHVIQNSCYNTKEFFFPLKYRYLLGGPTSPPDVTSAWGAVPQKHQKWLSRRSSQSLIFILAKPNRWRFCSARSVNPSRLPRARIVSTPAQKPKLKNQMSDTFPTEVIPEKSMEYTWHRVPATREFSFRSNTCIC